MTGNLVFSETTQALLNDVEKIRINLPTRQWFDIRSDWDTRSHLYLDCPRRRDSGTINTVDRSVADIPRSPCRACRLRYIRERPLRTATERAIMRTQQFNVAVRHAATGARGTATEALAALANADAAWRHVDQATSTDAASRPATDVACLETAQARRDHDSMRPAFRAVFEERARLAKAGASAASDAREVRYFCAAALSAGETGPFGAFGLSAPGSPLLADIISYDVDEDGVSSGAVRSAFYRFTNELRAGSSTTQAVATARQELARDCGTLPGSTDEYLATWAEHLAQVEAEQAAAGNVTLVLPPRTGASPWRRSDDVLLRWVDAIENDGTLTVTAPAALAGQMWAAHAEDGNAAVSQADNVWARGYGTDDDIVQATSDDPQRPVALLAADGVGEDTLAVVRRFFRPGSLQSLPALLNEAKLVTA